MKNKKEEETNVKHEWEEIGVDEKFFIKPPLPPTFSPQIGKIPLLFTLVHISLFAAFRSTWMVSFGLLWSIWSISVCFSPLSDGNDCEWWKKIMIHVRLSILGHVRVTNRQQGQCIGYFPNSKVHVSDPSLPKGKKKKKSPLPSRQALVSRGDFAWQWWRWYIFLLGLSWQWQWQCGDFG